MSIEKQAERMQEEDSHSIVRIVNDWNEASSSSNRREQPGPRQESQEKFNQLQHLHSAKERFRVFAEEIRELAYTPIREDILQYCDGQRKSEKCIEGFSTPEALLRKIDVRIEKMLKTKKLKRNWGEEDLRVLVWVVSKYSDLKGFQDLEKDISAEDWRFIASVIPGVTAEACMFKWLSIKKITLATHNWTSLESELLARIVKERLSAGDNGSQIKDWKDISQDLYRLNEDPAKVFRNAKQCREHWTCYLSPQLKKGPWQLYEDVKLLKFIRENKGLKKWSEIAKSFEGRTENALKNRYTLLIEKQKKLPRNKSKPELTLISEYLEKCYVDQFTASVKVEEGEESRQESIYREQSSMKECQELRRKATLIKREENSSSDTNESGITPLRVQKFSILDFQAMSLQFFKHIQPGIIKSDGTFRKIPGCVLQEGSLLGKEQEPTMPFAKIEEEQTGHKKETFPCFV